MKTRPVQRNSWRAILAGALGGAVGGWAMNRAIVGLSHSRLPHGAQALRGDDTPHRGNAAASDNPTMKVAGLALEELTAIHNRLEGRKRGGTIVHYSFAVFAGTAYGVLVEYSPVAGITAGSLYGAALWFGADFVVLPLTSLSKPAPVYGWRVEALSLAGHLAYGTLLEIVRKRVRRML